MTSALALLLALADGGVVSYQRDVEPVLVTYCYDCHGGGRARGEVALDAAGASRGRDGPFWSRVWENVRNGVMPPRGRPAPTPDERARLQAWIRRDVQGVDCRAPDPGRVTLRRLNRDEYNHTVADLFGIDLRPADDFPPDDSGHGFDNNADVLSVSPLLAEKYFTAAEQVVRRVVATRPEIPRRVVARDDLRPAQDPAGGVTVSEARFSIEHGGVHAVRVKLSVNSFKPFFGAARVRVELDGRPLLAASYRAGNRQYRRSRRVALTPGEHTVRFLLDLSRASANQERTINIALDEVEVVGPVGTTIREYPPAHRRLFFAGPAPAAPAERQAYARAIITGVAERAFRAPVEPETVDRLLALADEAERQTGRFERGIGQALQAILTSPRFLFRVEGPAVPGPAGSVRALDDHQLATRLSYFLHAGPPDEQLRALAAGGQLRANLAAQVTRMLRDPRSDRFVSRFVGQWLQTRDVETVALSGAAARALPLPLRKLMRQETERLFAHVLRQDRDALELVTADYSFLNGALARYYGVPGVEGPALRQVALPPDGHRGGLLTQGSFLTVTSNPTRTSPVKRGLFVLDNLLGMPPPPPPPDVPSLDDAVADGVRPKTVREQLAIHRQKPACAGCHARMDPLGLALEGYDEIGRWRDAADGQPVDTTATLASGEPIAGVDGVRALLVARREMVYRTLVRKLMTFALGRGLLPADECTVDALVTGMLTQGGRLSALLGGLVQSPPFSMQTQRGNRS